ncbi:NAC domain containing protein 52 [Brassica rapa]|uniref:NAC domain-containing protein n=1 Tax=Brassica campestris TaxID=3711 RepID=M4CXN3_BRACM|nr:NAC domain containing protein 52 [Brassica rapa]
MTDPVLPAPVTASGKPIGPGFRFHPTDEELITYYLKRKVEGKPMRFDVIREVNIYKHEPSDLAELSRLKTKDQEWYFFCPLEKRQNSSTVINRATKEGYWKKTGDDKKIKREGDDELIGVVKTLVYHRGRSPKGNRTNWVLYEYRLVQNKLEIDSYVVCRVIRKEHFGPSTECIYAPFSEQDWDDGINEKIQQGKNHIDEDPNTVDQDDNNSEPMTRGCLPLTTLVQYKRKRQLDSFGSYNNSSQTAQDAVSSVAATLEENEAEPVVPTSSSTEMIDHLEKERQQMAVARETYNLDLMSAEVMVSILQGQVDALRAENEGLKKTNSNKG